jgi:hypothetical protein
LGGAFKTAKENEPEGYNAHELIDYKDQGGKKEARYHENIHQR